MKSMDLYSNTQSSSPVLSGGFKALISAALLGVCLTSASVASAQTTPAAQPVAAPSATAAAPAPAVPAEPSPAVTNTAPTAEGEHALAEESTGEDATGFGGHDLSPWGMYQAADIVVKGVMIGLLLASLATWTIWLAKTIELGGAKRRLSRELVDLKQARTLSQAAEQATAKHSFTALLIEDAQEELRLSSHIMREKDSLKERISFRLERLVAACGRDMSKGTGVLATIGSTAPFVGLFGTVWGIMNSFIGIAKSQTTNLAVVAPGIAEALLATAIGLVAAIPAVVIYNVFARSIAGYKAQVADASAQVLLLVSRDLDHALSSPSPERGTGATAVPHMIKVK